MTHAQKSPRAAAVTTREPHTPPRANEEGASIVADDGSRVKRRHRTPPDVYRVPGNPGRVLAFLWTMAPWSRTDGAAFVWPKLATLEAALGLWPTSLRRALDRLVDLGWIRRDTREVRFEGRYVSRYGWVLNARPSDGPLFREVEAELAKGDVVVEAPHDVVETPPRDVVIASSIGTRSDQESTSARASMRVAPPMPVSAGAEEDQEDGKWEAMALWALAEQERCDRLPSTPPPRPCTPAREAEAKALLEHVRTTEGCDRVAARAQVEAFVQARPDYARRQLSSNPDRGRMLVAALVREPFSTKAYDAVMAHVAAGAAAPRPKTREEASTAWRAREFRFDDGREPLVYDDAPAANTPEISTSDMAAMADAFLASIRALPPGAP